MTSLLPLRNELQLHPATRSLTGHPCWLLEDPVRNSFYRIDWPTYEILARWDYGVPDFIVESINHETTLQISPEDIEEVATFLDTHCLVQRQTCEAALGLYERKLMAKKSTWNKLMHGYLFFRVPIVNPDPWLDRLLPVGLYLLSWRFFVVTLAALLFGIIQVSRQWDVFLSTLVDTFSFEGLFSYGLALVFVKVLHEFGHAFAAKKHGCKIPTMGIAFLVLFPMAYTDMNQVWRVTDRRKRLEIAVAGIRFELLVAAWATFLWVLLPDGSLRSALFFLATISWVLTILLNASPFMRFDGYFLLMDWLNFPNLHTRSGAVARWRLRRFLFGVEEECPEFASIKFVRFLTVFAFLTWIYRLFLFVGIAVLVYSMTTKLVGILLAAVEIYWFVLKPVIAEMKDWCARRQELIGNPRTKKTGFLVTLLFVVFILPLPLSITSDAVMRPSEYATIVLPDNAKLETANVSDRSLVGELFELFQFFSPAAEYHMALSSIRETSAINGFESAGVSTAKDLSMEVLAHHWLKAEADFSKAAEEASRFQISAPKGGRFYLEHPDIRSGQWIAGGEILGTVVPSGDVAEIVTWVSEAQISRISVGSVASFFSHRVGEPVVAKVAKIESDAANEIRVPAITAPFGGTILVREHNGKLVPEQALYKVTVRAKGRFPEGVHYGTVSISGEPGSLGGRYLRSAVATIVREFTP